MLEPCGLPVENYLKKSECSRETEKIGKIKECRKFCIVQENFDYYVFQIIKFQISKKKSFFWNSKISEQFYRKSSDHSDLFNWFLF